MKFSLAAIFAVVALLLQVPSWLVVADEPARAEVGVVLGGGSCLRTGLSLYGTGVVNKLVLVDSTKSTWEHIQKYLCPDCFTESKDVTVLEGSTDTFSDAELVEQFCQENGITSLLVITDPYHTRRASIVFHSRFELSNINISVVGSGSYVNYLSPKERWWTDASTLQVMLPEMSKIVFIFLRKGL